MTIPTKQQFLKAIGEFQRREKRDAMYKVATFLVSHFWGRPADMADGLGVLLLTWNQASYRYGSFDFARLEKCLGKNLAAIHTFRKREIGSMSASDGPEIRRLFSEFLDALTVWGEKTRKGCVATAKALHVLAPRFFPLWDYEIANAYGFRYSQKPPEKYLAFCWMMKAMAEKVSGYVNGPDKTILKLIDEYNYARFTKGWV